MNNTAYPQKTLILGAMPKKATPQTHFASGAWCFTGQENDFPAWWDETRPEEFFPLPDDPFPSQTAVLEASLQANAETARLIETFKDLLNKQHAVQFSSTFWEMAVGPWLLLTVHMLYERQTRIQDLITLYADQPLKLELLPENCVFSFIDSLDFMVNGVLDVDFNHFVFSRILEHQLPKAWSVRFLDPIDFTQKKIKPFQTAQGLQSFFDRIRRRVSTKLLKLPFPRIQGFPLSMTFLLSVGVLRNNKKNQDQSKKLIDYGTKPFSWNFPALRLITACLPKALLNGKMPFIPKSTNKLRGMSPVFSQNETYRLYLAAWKEGGGKLFCVQREANYGNLAAIGIIAFEYAQHAFFSWGFTKHPPFPLNAIPMPHPLLCRIRNMHMEKQPVMVFVGAEMSTFAHRLKTRPYAKNLVAYRTEKLKFLHALPEIVRRNTKYKPFLSVNGSLDDAPFIRQHFPGIPILRGDLTRQFLRCRLAVLDHYGTALHLALAAGVPTVCYWDQKHWGMNEESAALIALLEEAGIYHPNGVAAAGHIAQVWPDIVDWWYAEKTQKARQDWLDYYAVSQLPGYKPAALEALFRYWYKAVRSC